MRVLLAFAFGLILFAGAARADPISLEGTFVQGGFAEGCAPVGTTLIYDGIDVRVGADGRFVIGFHRDEPPETVLIATLPDGTRIKTPLSIAQRDYQIQRIDGLPKEKVTPPQAVLDRIAADAALVRAARARDSAETWYDSGWIWPATGRISGVFGSQRVLNGQPRQPHFGIDIAAPTGTPVVAPADGVVSLVHPDMYFSGGTIMIDHGRGLASTFLHMDTITVEEGTFIRQGEPIGAIGATGRATGPHLDWRINWFGKRLDAALFVGPMPES
jgi:murein DD-endopeptidase MepM/ murein hydrolase activator NlpD